LNSLWLIYVDFLAFSGSVVNTLASPEELAAGASIGLIGFGLPPRPPMVGTSFQPVILGLESGLCKQLCFLFCNFFVSILILIAGVFIDFSGL
jgi:hypothetical protein